MTAGGRHLEPEAGDRLTADIGEVGDPRGRWRRDGRLGLRPGLFASHARHEVAQAAHGVDGAAADQARSEEHTSELQSLMRISYAVFCLKKKKHTHTAADYRQSQKHVTDQQNDEEREQQK